MSFVNTKMDDELGPRKYQVVSKFREYATAFWRHENGVLITILLGIMGILAGVTSGATLAFNNVRNVWIQSSSRGIAAVGQAFVILTGGIDLSVGGIAVLSVIVGATLMKGGTGLPVGIIILMLALGIGIGAANGGLVSRVGMPALIVTLGMWQITRGAGYPITGGMTIRGLPEEVGFFGAGDVAGVPVPVIAFVSVVIVSYFVLHHTTFGRSIYAVGGNSVSSWLAGIKVRNILHWVYIISGFLAAFSGFIIMSRLMSGGLVTAQGLELDTIAATVIGGVSLAGGKGTVVGAAIGVMILGIISNGMNVFGLDPFYQDIVKGSIIIAAVAIDYIRRR